MRFIRRLFTSFSRSASEPSYYIEVLSTPIWFSLTLFLLVSFLLSIVTVAHWRLVSFPTLYTVLEKQLNAAITQIPDTTVIRYENERLVLDGVEEPLRIEAVDEFKADNFPTTLLAYTQSPENTALITLRDKDLTLHPGGMEEAGNRSYPYTDFLDENFTLTKSQLVARLQEFLGSAPQLATVASVVGTPLYWLFSTLLLISTLFFFSFILHTIFWVSRTWFPFGKVLQMTLHAGIVAQTIDTVERVLFPIDLPFSLFSMAFWGIIILVVWELRKKRVQFKKVER